VGGASVLVCQGKMIISDGETKSAIKRSLWEQLPKLVKRRWTILKH
jgi:hypothetical protein